MSQELNFTTEIDRDNDEILVIPDTSAEAGDACLAIFYSGNEAVFSKRSSYYDGSIDEIEVEEVTGYNITVRSGELQRLDRATARYEFYKLAGEFPEPEALWYGTLNIEAPPGETAPAVVLTDGHIYKANSLPDANAVKEDDLIVVNGDEVYRKIGESLSVLGAGQSTEKDLDIKVFLGGPYNSGTHLMNTTLNTAGYLPLAHPFNTGPLHYGGKEKVDSIPNVNVVDWVYVELRSNLYDAVAKRAGLLLNSGVIVDLNGTSALHFKDEHLADGVYYIFVKSRNHMGVMSATAVQLTSGEIASYDFTTAQAQAYGGDVGTPMKEVETGIFGLFTGDFANRGFTKRQGEDGAVYAFQNGSVGYKLSDVDLDGNVGAIDRNLHLGPDSGKMNHVPNRNNSGKQFNFVRRLSGQSTTDSDVAIKIINNLYGMALSYDMELYTADSVVIMDITLEGIAAAGTAKYCLAGLRVMAKYNGSALDLTVSTPSGVIPAGWSVSAVNSSGGVLKINAHGESGQVVDWTGEAKIKFILP